MTTITEYKAAQADAQREGYDVGTFPQWKKTQEKKAKFKEELLGAKGQETPSLDPKPKPKRGRKPKQE